MTVKSSEIHRTAASTINAVDDQELEQDWLLLWSSSDTIAEEDTAEISASMLFSAESTSSTFWSGEFIPPPPRPAYLEDQISADGLTTCDLCTWALEKYSEPDSNFISLNFGLSNHLFVILIVVSILSACLGAIIMIALIHCKSRMNSTDDPHRNFFSVGRRKPSSRNSSGDGGVRSKKKIRNDEISLEREIGKNVAAANAVDVKNFSASGLKPSSSWNLLNRSSKRTVLAMQLTGANVSTPATNHYTVEEAYASINDNEAVYTELDRVSSSEVIAIGPPSSYRNTGYITESDNNDPISSAPSSAYYSDISGQQDCCNGNNGNSRAYETVGEQQCHHYRPPAPLNVHSERTSSGGGSGSSRQFSSNDRGLLSAIRENTTGFNSNYI